MSNFEQAFSNVELAADLTQKRATDLLKMAKQLKKAAIEGNVVAVKRCQSRLDSEMNSLQQEVANAQKSWTIEEQEEELYLGGGYAGSFCGWQKNWACPCTSRTGN